MLHLRWRLRSGVISLGNIAANIISLKELGSLPRKS
jgi:hypothetical protein